MAAYSFDVIVVSAGNAAFRVAYDRVDDLMPKRADKAPSYGSLSARIGIR
jgi:hypothetical protein